MDIWDPRGTTWGFCALRASYPAGRAPLRCQHLGLGEAWALIRLKPTLKKWWAKTRGFGA